MPSDPKPLEILNASMTALAAITTGAGEYFNTIPSSRIFDEVKNESDLSDFPAIMVGVGEANFKPMGGNRYQTGNYLNNQPKSGEPDIGVLLGVMGICKKSSSESLQTTMFKLYADIAKAMLIDITLGVTNTHINLIKALYSPDWESNFGWVHVFFNAHYNFQKGTP